MSLPKLDPTITMADLQEEAAKFLAAGHAYWTLMNSIPKMGGAIAWVSDTDGATVIFTRGEYRGQLLRNIENHGPVYQFGAGATNAA